MSIVRVVTAGSVDDGKSTLIGRLLYDAGVLLEDQLSAAVSPSGTLKLSNLTDGLKAEREQGITIDVAHRHFEIDSQRFLIADAPGHFEYIRNMVTAASTADAALLLVDAVQGTTEQTKRHALLAHFLGVSNIAVCINKLDLANYSEKVFDRVAQELREFALRTRIRNLELIPVSALVGDNILERSGYMPWYDGQTVLEFMKGIDTCKGLRLRESKEGPLRFSVQGILRTEANGSQERFFTGHVTAGTLRRGADVIVLPSRRTATVRRIFLADEERTLATAGQAVGISTSEHIDIERGNVLSNPNVQPYISNRVEAILCSFNGIASDNGKDYLLKHNHRLIRARIKKIHTRLNLRDGTFQRTDSLAQNEIGTASLLCSEELIFDPYSISRELGGFILIDPITNTTCAAGLLQAPCAG